MLPAFSKKVYEESYFRDVFLDYVKRTSAHGEEEEQKMFERSTLKLD